MRHLAIGQPCPIDATPVSRSHCAGCPSFVSFRSSDGVATVGCAYGEDVVAWLRQEMRDGGSRRAPAARSPRTRARPRPQAPRRRPGLAPGTSLGLFAVAFGLGLALSVFERPD